MDLLNRHFHKLLLKNSIYLKKKEEFDQFHYKGRITIDGATGVDFTVSLSKGDTQGIIQIVYHKINHLKMTDDLLSSLRLVNELNRKHGIYFYFCVSEQGELYMRYASEATVENIDFHLEVLKKGATILRSVWPHLNVKTA